LRTVLVVAAHAFVGWALCFATIGIAMALTTVQTALIVHAIGAPIIFWAVSTVYFRRFGYTTPLETAIAFTAFVMLMDFLLVGLVILRSLDMFASPLGTWIPFTLIFASTWLAGLALRHRLGPNASGERDDVSTTAALNTGPKSTERRLS
jgi:hypothetical protein